MSLASEHKQKQISKKQNHHEVVLASLGIKTSFSETEGLDILLYFRFSDFQMFHCSLSFCLLGIHDRSRQFPCFVEGLMIKKLRFLMFQDLPLCHKVVLQNAQLWGGFPESKYICIQISLSLSIYIYIDIYIYIYINTRPQLL